MFQPTKFLAGLSMAVALMSTVIASGSNRACQSMMDGKLPSTLPAGFNYSGTVRRYYIAAEEVEWDYAPTGWDNWLGVPINISPRAMQFTQYNTTFLKALYRGYTDASFKRPTEQAPSSGIQGPLIRSEVGDMIEIMFVNKLSRNYATMHSMGLAYNKQSEGADYANSGPGTESTVPPGSAVPPVQKGVGPGECVVYKWLVDPAAGPNDGTAARAHSYHSYIDLDTDSNSGLIGPQVVYAAGQMAKTMASTKEFPILYMIFNEAHSFFSGQNAQKLQKNHSADAVTDQPWGAINTESLWKGNQSVWQPQVINLNSSGLFSNAPMFHSINGYIYANNPPFTMHQTDNVIWYAYSYGGASHAMHMHGNGFVDDGRNQFATDLNNGVSKTLYMTAANAGLWQVICHVQDHQQHGMVANYLVTPQ